MTLTEFLLARIAEDEKAINEWGTEHQSDGWELFDSDEYNHVNMSHGRALGERKAKRLIVDEHEASADPPEVCFCDGEAHPCPTVRALALPYATHPDFDPAWSVTAADC